VRKEGRMEGEEEGRERVYNGKKVLTCQTGRQDGKSKF
jgi:hypothetical protein